MGKKYLKIITIVSFIVYLLVLLIYYICDYFIKRQGLEFRSNISELRVFWTFKLPFVLVALLLITIFVNWREREKGSKKHKYDLVIGLIGTLIYGVFSCFLIFVLIFSGLWEAEQEEMLETGYLRVQDISFPDVSFYYCVPVNAYLRKPLTDSSEILFDKYESIEYGSE